MSTRCNVIIKSNGKEFILYHHFDGYPEGVGADLKEKLHIFTKDRSFFNVMDFVNGLIKADEGKGSRGYELTDCIHGDIEYLYIIDFDIRELETHSIDRFMF